MDNKLIAIIVIVIFVLFYYINKNQNIEGLSNDEESCVKLGQQCKSKSCCNNLVCEKRGSDVTERCYHHEMSKSESHEMEEQSHAREMEEQSHARASESHANEMEEQSHVKQEHKPIQMEEAHEEHVIPEEKLVVPTGRPAGYIYYIYKNAIGGGGKKVENRDYKTCLRGCLKRTSCRGASFNPTTNECLVHLGKVADVEQKKDWIHGKKMYQFYNKRDTRDKPYKIINDLNSAQCRKSCSMDDNCKQFFYKVSGKSCQLKNKRNFPSVHQTDKSYSGIKY
jgi:hypothetical protein